MTTIILYHGSAYDFQSIDLRQCRPFKDFGQGFYLSTDIAHAKSMAERNTEMRKRKLNNFDSGQQIISNWLYEFKFDLGKSSSLSVKIFTGPDIEWGRFITLSRSHRGILHDYDIVIGPTANDYTNPTIQFYLSGGLGEVGSDAAIDELVRLLWPFKLSPQYYFATQRAISCLTLIRKGIF